jgi:hypothetical protein
VSVKGAGGMDMVDPEVYETISQHPETIAEIHQLIMETAALWQRWYDLGLKLREEGRANAPFIM